MEVLIRWAFVATAALMIVGCEFLRDPLAVDVPGSIQVHSILLAGRDTAAVLVTRVDPDASNSSVRIPPHAVSGARVLLIRGGDTLPLIAGADGGEVCVPNGSDPFQEDPGLLAGGCYTGAVPGGIESGDTYELRVHLPDGRIAEGKAIVPQAPQLIAPEGGSVLVDSLQARWVMVPDRVLHLQIDLFQEGCQAFFRIGDGFGAVSTLSFMDVDSAAVRLGFLDCVDSGDGSQAGDLVLTVYDAPYTHYLNRGPSSIDAETASVGLTGVYGVFAGAAQDRVPLSIQSQDSP